MDFAVVGPASPGARAQLLLALIVCAVFPTLYVLTPQSHAHGVTFDSIFGLDVEGRPGEVGPPVWMEPAPLRRDRSVRRERWGLPVARGAAHLVGINAAGTFFFDGCALDLVSLRERIDLLQLSGEGWLDLRPDPDARWETVDIALATFARAHVERFRFDNRRFRGAIDAPQAGPERQKSQRVRAPVNCPPLVAPID